LNNIIVSLLLRFSREHGNKKMSGWGAIVEAA
jgi:hypothetical protein